MENCGKRPSEILMSPTMFEKVRRMMEEQGIEIKGRDGNDYVMGLKVRIDDRCIEDMAFIKTFDSENQ